MCPRGRPRGQGRPRGLHLWSLLRFLAKKRSSPSVSVLKPSAQVKKGGPYHNFAYFFMLIILPWRPKGEGHGPMAPPKYALGFGILQTAKNRSFECIMMQNGNHLLIGDMALSRWKNFIGTKKLKQRKRRVFMFILVVKPAVT